jgi:hypothetical protein
MSYQGPNVSVTQVFQTNPPAVAIENLPSAVVATAYDVYSKELLGTHYGFVDDDDINNILWPASKVIYDASVLGEREFAFYPAKVFAQTPEFGNVELEDVERTATDVRVIKDEAYTVPGFDVAAGSSRAYMPYYSRTLTAGGIILGSDAQTLTVAGAAFVTANLKRGIAVYSGIRGTSSSFAKLGTILTVGPDETRIKLSKPTAIDTSTHDTIIVGAMALDADGAEVVTGLSFADLSLSAYLYDPDADFTTIRQGDLAVFNSISFAAAVTASVQVVVSQNMIRINTATATATDIARYKTSAENPGVTVDISEYKIQRLVGFARDYDLASLNTGAGVQIKAAAGSLSFEVFKEAGGGANPIGFALKRGDVIILSLEHDVPSSRDVSYRIDTIVYNPTGGTNGSGSWVITVGEKMYTDLGVDDIETVDGTSDVFLHAYEPKIETSIVADFRAVNTDELGVVKRITSPEDIAAAWAGGIGNSISVYNELAFMASIIRGLNGGRVMYGVNVDPTTGDLSGVYADALEELKMYDVYSHCFGTTDGGINSLIGPYCDEQSAPYEGHERIGVVCYDTDDVYTQGTDSGENSSTGTITLDGGFNPITGGVQAGDVVDIYTSANVFVETVNITDTPSTPLTVETDGETVHAAGHIYRFRTARKAEQAQKLSAISLGNRRVSVVFPGWFYAVNNGSRISVPPYYITAAVAGMDGGIQVSQSFTNYDFSIPGLSNYELNTSTYFRKAQLDTIGGAGIDIMIQDATVTQTIKSRHDLTSNMDAVEYSQRSITKQADVAAKTLRNATNPYVGKYNISNELLQFLGKVGNIAATLLEKKGIIAKLEILSIARDENVVNKVNINIKVTVWVAGDYYDITMLVVSR